MANTTTKTKTASRSAAKKAAPARRKQASSQNKGSRKKQEESSANTEPLLKEYFVEELKDIYWAEKKLVTALPKLQKAATTEELQDALGEHLEVTKEHVRRLEQVFEILGEKAQAKKCEAMEGIVKEGESVIEDTDEGTATRDVALIMAAQKAEHYEIATYGGLTQLATTLGLQDVADILGSTLEEEKQADETLTGIAENNVNYAASSEGEDEEGEEGEEPEGDEEEEEEEE
jgi:ferritin-like metal-binding protein YciE